MTSPKRTASRRDFLYGASAVAAGLALGLGPPPSVESLEHGNSPEALPPPNSKRPNFLVVLCDDLGYGDLGCYGHPHIRTPHLDRFAAEGVRLSDAYAAAPVCSPARAGMLTGRTPHRCGIYDWIPENSPVHLRREEVTVATLLREVGYATAHVGKWHCNGRFNQAEQPQPGDHGFDHWFSTQNNAKPSHRNPVNFVRNGEEVGRIEGYSSTLIADEAIRWLREDRDQAKPFCLFVWFHAPHEPIATPPEFMAWYEDIEPEQQRMYFGNVSEIDQAFGKMLHALDDLGEKEETLVFFTSDNGPETLNRYRGSERSYGSAGPLCGMKLHLYEGGIRVPGLARMPGRIPAGQVSSAPVCGTDILPTCCALAGIEPPAGRTLDGEDVLPLLCGATLERQKPLYWRYDRALSRPYTEALRQGDWKLLADAECNRLQLYHLSEDIGETRNLAEKEPGRLSAMRDVLDRIHRDVAAEAPVWPEV